jgi:hypothetical protein
LILAIYCPISYKDSNHLQQVGRAAKGIKAVIAYPMSVLINPQSEEIEKHNHLINLQEVYL